MHCWSMQAYILFRFQEISILKFSTVAVPWLLMVGLFGTGPSSINDNMGTWFRLLQRKLVEVSQGELLFLGRLSRHTFPSKYNQKTWTLYVNKQNKTDQLGTLRPKERHDSDFLGFSFALYIPDLKLKNPTGWKCQQCRQEKTQHETPCSLQPKDQ